MPSPLAIFFLALVFSGPLLAYDNVLLISIDTLRVDYLGCYGSTRVPTPGIDSLAKQGVLYKNTVAPAPLTLPSHISILTGLTPLTHGVHDNGYRLNPKVVTLAEVLKSKGFQTAAFVGAFPLDSRFGLDQGFQHYDDSYPLASKESPLLMPERNAEKVVDSVLNWFQTHPQNRWFVFVHFYDPHYPYNPPEKFKMRYPENFYAGEVAYVDEQIGRLLEFLKSKNLLKKTLIVLTSDHGESLGEHGEKSHSIFAYESTLRVPWIVAPVEKPQVVEQRVRLIDVFPTILSLLKIPYSSKIDGEEASFHVGDSYFEALAMHLSLNWAPLRGFYSGSWKFIDLPEPELYNLEKDPRERNNLCKDQQLCKVWKQRFRGFLRTYQGNPLEPQLVDSETAEQLQALGYIAIGSSGYKKEYTAEDDPKNLIRFQTKVEEAMAFYHDGYELKALEILEKIMEEKKDYIIAYQYAAFIWNSLGLAERSVEVLQSAVNNGVHNSKIEGDLGRYLLDTRSEEAVIHLEKAIREDPSNLEYRNLVGKAYRNMGQLEKAEKALKDALALDPSDDESLTNLGILYASQKKNDLALDTLQKAISFNPNNAISHNAMGTVYASMNNRAAAIQSWKQALEINKNLYDAMFNLGIVYVSSKEKQKGLSLLRDFVEKAPSYRYARQIARAKAILATVEEAGE